jgi:nucleoside-diphosphate-sugar epimerase
VNWKDQTIFVSGATGFIGGRICERLIQAGAHDVRALVHTIQRAPRIARLPLKLCTGNLLDRQSLRQAVGDSRIVIHLGLGYGGGIVRGTRNLLEIAEAGKVNRFIHMSTAAVYGLNPPVGCETEEAPSRLTGNIYCDNKVRAEQVVKTFHRRGLPVVVLRPAIVYGPYSFWSTKLVANLSAGKVALIDEGKGACNTSYVDNLIDATFLALENDAAVGETFLITDGERVTWGDFIRAHAEFMEPRPSLPQISTEQILTYHREQPGLWSTSLRAARQVLMGAELRELVRRIPVCDRALTGLWMSLQSMDEERKERLRRRLRGSGDVIATSNHQAFVPDLETWATQTGTVYFRIDKARRILGYEPRVAFSSGIKYVEQWLRFANYL